MNRRDWFIEHRQQWISERLRIFGFINRKHIRAKFGVSLQQASADLSLFQAEHPDACFYDKSAKQYRAHLEAGQ